MENTRFANTLLLSRDEIIYPKKTTFELWITKRVAIPKHGHLHASAYVSLIT